mmetsp:Transcript_63984/g.198091  ORF Transcript_63984/g.198091 Transcript_63984/m.198091 type:complete len:98 (-) Transcript_63984:437-730(-)
MWRLVLLLSPQVFRHNMTYPLRLASRSIASGRLCVMLATSFRLMLLGLFGDFSELRITRNTNGTSLVRCPRLGRRLPAVVMLARMTLLLPCPSWTPS